MVFKFNDSEQNGTENTASTSSPRYQMIHKIFVGFQVVRSNQARVNRLPLQIRNNLGGILTGLEKETMKFMHTEAKNGTWQRVYHLNTEIQSHLDTSKILTVFKRRIEKFQCYIYDHLQIQLGKTKDKEPHCIPFKELLSQLGASFSSRLRFTAAI